MELGFRMHAERTPNPNSIKWVMSQPVAPVGEGIGGGAHFDAAPSSEESPLAARLFEVAGVTRVFLGPNFVTVSKSDALEWTDLAQPVVDGIKAWVESGESAVGAAWEPPDAGADSEIVGKIKRILENEIRPYVAQDGGEITFASYRDGVVEVFLQGACEGCPSSTVTLRMGIESRLKEEIPEIQSVVSV